ncbi:inositol monophosphatase family protein [Labilibaculum sp. K2S]|uniref:inositol monophosphatase family protein n=1 Tax=Labilibaculum sp. K2S TaxID=3056386 RepID=UPI0025A34605|nr:inositol monophosphatase family protein [Labilibaculum sp. K2S]MDM8161949.1 inositol monophosphatase family protein [Labilibaculum sp. K2S]
MINLKELCFKTNDIARKVGLFIKEQQSKIKSDVVEVKGIHDFVTYVDKTAEEKIVAELKLILSDAGFIAEEGTETYQAERYNWIIDPLDGTTNYIHGLSPFAVSIALQEYDEIILGVIYEISLDECFYSWKGASEAFLNGKTITVSKANSIDSSLIATGFPYSNYDQLKTFMASLEYFIINSHGVRRPGSAATDLAYVACGRFEAFYEYSLQAWDVAAGSFLVSQAGGKVCDFKGGKNFIFGKEIIASNTMVHDEFKSVVIKHMIK